MHTSTCKDRQLSHLYSRTCLPACRAAISQLGGVHGARPLYVIGHVPLCAALRYGGSNLCDEGGRALATQRRRCCACSAYVIPDGPLRQAGRLGAAR